MPRLQPRFLVAASALVAAAACTDSTDPTPAAEGVTIVAGGSGSDTVMARRDQALVVELRDAAGRPRAGMSTVRFEVLAPDAPRDGESGLYLCLLSDVDCSSPRSALEVHLDGGSRASVRLRHGTLAGVARVRVVADVGAADTATYETRAGAAVHAGLGVRDTTIEVGSSLTLPDVLSRLDRYGNVAGAGSALTLVATTANLSASQDAVTGSAVGRGEVVFAQGERRDTMRVSVTPAGRLALAHGNLVVIANYSGQQMHRMRIYEGLQSVLQYGLHPEWAGPTRIIVHSGEWLGRLHMLDLESGAVHAMPTSSQLSAQWYPAVHGDYVYFMGETVLGTTYRIWREKLDGSELGPVGVTTPDYGNYYRPQVSPDGTKLAVSVVVDGAVGVRIFTFPAMTAISPFVPNATAPRWSPSGDRVAFSTPHGGPIRMMQPDGAGLETLAPGSSFGEWFDWTNDAQHIVASRGDRVALVNVHNGHVMPLAWTVGMWQPAVAR